MTTIDPKLQSKFVQAALALDASFQDFARLAAELGAVTLETPEGVELGRVLLGELESCREDFTPASQALGAALEEAKQDVAKAAVRVALHQQEIRKRGQVVEQNLLASHVPGLKAKEAAPDLDLPVVGLDSLRSREASAGGLLVVQADFGATSHA